MQKKFKLRKERIEVCKHARKKLKNENHFLYTPAYNRTISIFQFINKWRTHIFARARSYTKEILFYIKYSVPFPFIWLWRRRCRVGRNVRSLLCVVAHAAFMYMMCICRALFTQLSREKNAMRGWHKKMYAVKKKRFKSRKWAVVCA